MSDNTGKDDSHQQHHNPAYACIPQDVCYQSQKLFGTYVTIPPIFCVVNCVDKTKKRRMQHAEDEAFLEEEEYPSDEENYATTSKKRKQEKSNDKPQKPKKKPKCIDRREGLKVGSFSFPARNHFYFPRQTLEDTVLELYKKESYPARRLD